MNRSIVLVSSLSIVLSGCSTASKDIATSYVSPLQYQGYDCGQIASELNRIRAHVVELSGRLDQAATNDKAIVGVGLLIFWPALFALGGTKQQEAEYSRLKGEYDALTQAAIAKRCPGLVNHAVVADSSVLTDAISVDDTEKRINLLRELMNKGIITESEFNAKRKEAIDLVLSGQAGGGTVATQSPNRDLTGLRFIVRDSDPLTKVTTGETVVSIDSLSSNGAVLNSGATTLDATGKVIGGAVLLPHIAGLGGGRLYAGFVTVAKFIASSAPPAEVKVSVTRMDKMVVGDRELSVAWCKILGYTPIEQPYGTSLSWKNAEISGEIAVEPFTGLVLRANVKSHHPYYNLNRVTVSTVVR